jgi:hypothetical protein
VSTKVNEVFLDHRVARKLSPCSSPNVSDSCGSLVPERAKSTTCLRASGGYHLLGIASFSLSAGGLQKPASAKPPPITPSESR